MHRCPKFLDSLRRSRKEIAICLALIGSVVFLYASLLQAGFVNFDDFEYVSRNPHVYNGFSWSNIFWAFKTTHAGNWHPLTWLSHMLDCQLFGLNAGAHHLVNVAFHAANAALLFLLFRTMTRQLWPSAVLAALFALHPLRVESVAWISERKDVLSTFFGLLSMLAYVRFTQEGASKSRFRARAFYVLAFLLFALALMAKPMLVTLPLMYLLVDYWPLRRVKVIGENENGLRPVSILIEKFPFFVISVAVCAVTVIAHKQGIIASISMETRAANAAISCLRYIRKIIWPTDLSVLYSYPTAISGIAAAYGILVAVSAVALLLRRKAPWLLVGWFWFLGAIFPVSGVIQTGVQALADRYTYLASTGLAMMLIWSLLPLLKERLIKLTASGAVMILLATFATCTWYQVAYWRSTLSLFQAALLQDENAEIERYVADALANAGYAREAEGHFKRSLALNPNDPETVGSYGSYLSDQGRSKDAVPLLEKALQMDPDSAFMHFSFGNTLHRLKRFSEADSQYRKALQLNPELTGCYFALGNLMAEQNRLDDAVGAYKQILQISPVEPQAHFLLGRIYAQESKQAEAINELNAALVAAPAHALACNDLAWILATAVQDGLRNPGRAVALAEKACALEPQNAGFLDTLGVAYASAGMFKDAERVTRSAEEIARERKEMAFVAELDHRIEQYQNHIPYRPVSNAR